MPIGLILIVQDKLNKFVIKYQYLIRKIEFSQDFINDLSKIHRKDTKILTKESIYEKYQIISKYTGLFVNFPQKEAILAIVFEENEPLEDLDFFLHVQFEEIVQSPSNSILEKIYNINLKSYCSLVYHLKRLKIEGIKSVYVIYGKSKYFGKLLQISSSKLPNIAKLYIRIINNEKIKDFYWFPISLKNLIFDKYRNFPDKDRKNYYLLVEIDENNKKLDFIINNFHNALQECPKLLIEYLYLLLAPNEVCLVSPEFIKNFNVRNVNRFYDSGNVKQMDFKFKLDCSETYQGCFLEEFEEIKNRRKFFIPLDNVIPKL